MKKPLKTEYKKFHVGKFFPDFFIFFKICIQYLLTYFSIFIHD